MVAKSEGGDLRQKLTQLNTRWNEMTNDVFEKHKALQSASEQYGEFRGTFFFFYVSMRFSSKSLKDVAKEGNRVLFAQRRKMFKNSEASFQKSPLSGSPFKK